MTEIRERGFISASEIEGHKTLITNDPLVGLFNSSRFEYTVHIPRNASYVIFYVPSLDGDLDSFADVDELLVTGGAGIIKFLSFPDGFGPNRTHKFFLNDSVTFGDFCTVIYNSSKLISHLAAKYKLEKYSVYGHGWGGFICAAHGVKNPKCEKALLLSSTPDICDALTYPAIAHNAPNRSAEANKAKFGGSTYQDAWSDISPYTITNTALKMRIFNNADDEYMRRDNILHYREYCATHKLLPHIRADFVYNEWENKHDMPSSLFLPTFLHFFRTEINLALLPIADVDPDA